MLESIERFIESMDKFYNQQNIAKARVILLKSLNDIFNLRFFNFEDTQKELEKMNF